jgi:hypothetical protein
MTAAAVPFARSGFRVLLRPSFEVCAQRAATGKEGPSDYAMLKKFYGRFEEGNIEPICDDYSDRVLARQIADGLNQGKFRVI